MISSIFDLEKYFNNACQLVLENKLKFIYTYLFIWVKLSYWIVQERAFKRIGEGLSKWMVFGVQALVEVRTTLELLVVSICRCELNWAAESISIIFVYSDYRVLLTFSFSDILSFCNKYNCHHYTYNSYVYILIIHLKTA